MNDFADLANALSNIDAQEQAASKENQNGEGAAVQQTEEKLRVVPILASEHLTEIEMMTKKAEIAKKASIRKLKKKEHFTGIFEKKCAKERAHKLEMKRDLKKSGKKK
ncbi:hypothetical protein TVAG_436420 [Trichomonas vaginalis G3]|uniref:Uncharacterized protein n=1 Tax=Trichomonas vaginalis (strain ATCC PRA-98 / G3) TaxID=412133 RepID=A2DF90_TRIV3|nr:hypothetical protein TVAGG3_0565870 [Trichomonas vaginalis G3]EAY20818.1 hypothetical protein TVAG_436420 [Trichomonas vaginalis G3]KAI5521574.1 hypothetical protein TVAGG3_0565870 [Trichomonas vaginalis G3]|eukprot:XP_001581804.1 hypothetical protein [Trichomonas vaginalis G3]